MSERNPAPDTEKVKALYADGWTIKRIAPRVGCSHETVRQILLRAGMSLRPRSYRSQP